MPKFLVVVLIIVLVAGAFYLGKQNGTVNYVPTPTPVSYSPSTTTYPQSPIPTSITKTSECVNGFKLFTNNIFSICYPNDMTKKNEYHPYVNDQNITASTTTFENDNEKIVINTSFIGGWGGGATSLPATIAGFPSNILTFKDQTGNIINVVAIVGNQNQSKNFPIAIDYQRKKDNWYISPDTSAYVVFSLNLVK